jgi:hypothetical protein
MSTTVNDEPLSRWFKDCVMDEFQFLMLHGFRYVDSPEESIQFTSSIAKVEVYRDVRSNEISLQFSNQPGNQSYSISELVRLFEGTEAARKYRDYASHTREGVKEGVHKLAMKLLSFIDSPEWRIGNLFERLEASGKVWAYEYSVETQLEQVRKKVALAWHSKDYRSVVELLSPFIDYLSNSESKKLEYAKKH